MEQLQSPTGGPQQAEERGDDWDTDLEDESQTKPGQTGLNHQISEGIYLKPDYVIPDRARPDHDKTPNAQSEKHTPSLADIYLEACSDMGTVPVRYVLRHLGEASLNLNHHGIGPLGAKALATVLQFDTSITSLELEDNSLRAVGAHYVVEMLQSNINIISLNLSRNHLRLEGARIISKMMSDNYYVKSIKLSGNGFDDSSATYFADALKDDYVIKELDLSHNKFSETGGEQLGQMLAGNLGIEVLNLSWNNLSMKGAVALCAALKVNSTLKNLLLESNGFSGYVAESLSQALKVNSTLVMLDLNNNLIDDAAINLLVPGLAINSTLKVLKLSNNIITSVGALTLLKTIKNNTRTELEKLDVSTVFVCEDFVELLAEVRRRIPHLVVHYSVMPYVTRRLSVLPTFKKYLKEQKKSLMESFQALDKDGTMKVSTAGFRNVIKAAQIPLDQNQIEWLVRKLDSQCTATISYSQFANMT